MAPTAEPVPVRQRRTQQERREQAESSLLHSAAELIAEQGVERTSLAQIGERAGYSRGIVNHHFGTRLELFKRLVVHAQMEFNRRLPGIETRTGFEAVIEVADAYVTALGSPGVWDRAFFIMWAESAGATSDLRPAFVMGDRRFRNAITEFVTRGIDDGSIRGDAEPAAFAAAYVAQLRGLGLELLIDATAFDADDVRREVLRIISAALAPGGSTDGPRDATRRRRSRSS